MTSENEGSKAAVLSDLELEEHLTSLGLASVEEYTAWCAQHGFSTRVKKRWLERCRERYYAAQHQIRHRLASKRRESRHPRETLRKIAGGEPEPLEPNFLIKGRTPASLLRQMHGWHTDLRKQPEGDQITWHASGIAGFDWTEGTLVSENLRQWTIREIVTWKDLRGEGGAMRHCVASYMHACATGRTSIWSLGIERNEQRRRRVLTVEVAVDRKVICQARGRANRMPKESEVNVLRRWAAQEGLTLDEHIG